MRSPKQVYRERIVSLLDQSKRFTDMTARVRIYRRGDTGAEPAELLPEVYGGVWDAWAGEYVKLGEPVELKLHPGQVKLLRSFDLQTTKRRTLALGSQGGGKSEAIIAAAVLLSLWHAGKCGGVVAPTRQRLKVVWRKFLALIPSHWVVDIRPGDMEVKLANGSLIQFFAAKKQSRQGGSPFAGNDWFWCVEDEQQDIDDASLEEVDARGRVNPYFQVFSSATNEPYGNFQRRVKEYESHPAREVVRFTGPENSFVDPKHWENLRQNWDSETYRRKILCEDVPVDGSVYSAFSMKENVRKLLPGLEDITLETTRTKYGGEGYNYVVGVDFGQRTSASVIMKCFRAPPGHGWQRGDRLWWIVDEVTTENRTTDWHASALLEWFGNDYTKFIAITGQDSNSTDPDRSNFVLFKKRSIQIMRAAYGSRLSVTHRYSMVNALLHAADGKRRLFVDCDANGKVKAKKVVESFQGLTLNSSDRAESFGKGSRGEDLTHWTDCCGYALFPFEAFRGVHVAKTVED